MGALVMKKILIIEDDPVVANIYRNKYQVSGYDAESASTGEFGLLKIKSYQPDVVQLDLMLPKMNGVEVIKKLREQPETKSLPVIVVSNSYMASMVKDAWKAGATKCISKSECTPKLMMEIIEKMFAPAAPVAPPPQAVPPSGNTGFFYAQGTPMPQGGGTAFFMAMPPNQTAPPSVAPVSSAQTDIAFQEEIRKTFTDSGPETITALRNLTHKLVKADQEAARKTALADLSRKIRSLTSNAAMAGMNRLSRLSVALEALLKEIYDKPENITPSVLRTVTLTIDQLVMMIERGSQLESNRPLVPNILVVDDEMISRRAVIHALDKANLKCLSLDNPQAALSMLSENKFDLIFLDVDMPVMDGFELCQKLRALPNNQKTPVVFVTGMSDFENRAKSTLAGGNDLIAKPFIFMELAVKALTYILKAEADMA